jgi:hypothetical protein
MTMIVDIRTSSYRELNATAVAGIDGSTEVLVPPGPRWSTTEADE